MANNKERMERMHKLREMMKGAMEAGGALEIRFYINYSIFYFGLSKRAATEEVEAIIGLEGWRCMEDGIIYERTRQKKIEEKD